MITVKSKGVRVWQEGTTPEGEFISEFVTVSGSATFSQDMRVANDERDFWRAINAQAHDPEDVLCSGPCRQWKKPKEFSPNPRNLSGVHSWCRECRNKAERRRYAEKRNHPVRAYHRQRG